MRIVFMGTPEFAVPSLKALIDAGYEVAGVVTQPDRPVGRKKTLTPPPVKALAMEHNIPVLQFERIRRPEGRQALEFDKLEFNELIYFFRLQKHQPAFQRLIFLIEVQRKNL